MQVREGGIRTARLPPKIEEEAPELTWVRHNLSLHFLWLRILNFAFFSGLSIDISWFLILQLFIKHLQLLAWGEKSIIISADLSLLHPWYEGSVKSFDISCTILFWKICGFVTSKFWIIFRSWIFQNPTWYYSIAINKTQNKKNVWMRWLELALGNEKTDEIYRLGTERVKRA